MGIRFVFSLAKVERDIVNLDFRGKLEIAFMKDKVSVLSDQYTEDEVRGAS
jgi:hypothetical protein